jgi:hypothetical protein
MPGLSRVRDNADVMTNLEVTLKLLLAHSVLMSSQTCSNRCVRHNRRCDGETLAYSEQNGHDGDGARTYQADAKCSIIAVKLQQPLPANGISY